MERRIFVWSVGILQTRPRQDMMKSTEAHFTVN